MFEFIDKIKDKYRQNRVEKLLNVQKSLSEIEERIDVLFNEKVAFTDQSLDMMTKSDNAFEKASMFDELVDYKKNFISELAQLKLNKNKLLKSEQSLTKEDPLFKSMYDHMRFEATYKEVTKGYRQGQIDLDRCDEILKAINNDKKVKYSDNLVFNTEGKLLLLKRSELDKTFPGMYTIPGGHVDAGEDHRTAAIRELQEESGLTPDKDSQFTKVGEYEDDKVCIEYFLSYVDNDSDTLCLQSEEAWQYEWVESKELDKYEFPLNMKQNIQKILFPQKEVIQKLGKALRNKEITKSQFIQLYKAINHKYIDKKLNKFGNFYYIYKENENSFNNGKEKENSTRIIEDSGTTIISNSIQGSPEEYKGERKASWQLNKLREEETKPITVEDIKLDNKGQIEVFFQRQYMTPESGIDFPILVNKKVVGYIQKREEGDYWFWDHDKESNKRSSTRFERKKEAIESFIKEYNSEINNVNKSFQSIDELYLQNRLSDELYEKIIEKAWKKSPIGTIVTRSNGQKWKKVSETGNKDQDWQLVSKPKVGSKADESVSKEKRAEYGTKGKQPTISEYAKQSSETALNAAIKESQDPKVREAAHEELDRREKEEHVQEEEKKDGEEKKEANEHVEKFRQLSDEQVKFYLDAPYPKVKAAAQMVADERGLSVVSKEDYIKSFEDYTNKSMRESGEFYKEDGLSVRMYLMDNPNERRSLDDYVGMIMFKDLRDYHIGKIVNKEYGNELKKHSDNLSKFISNNKITKDLILNRRVLTGGTFFNNLKEGDIYSDDSFSSTSLLEIQHFGDFNIKILAKKGSNVANADNIREQEYLVDKGSKFRVLEKKDNGITVELL
jgi:mutator protein MutT